MTITLDDRQVQINLSNLKKGLENMHTVLLDTGDVVLQKTDKQFDTQGSNLGTKWKGLSSEYKKWKERNYPGNPILVRTGEMRSSFTHEPKNPKTYIRLFNRLENERFIWHQLGTYKMPARPMFVLGDKLIKIIITNFEKYCQELTTKFNYG